MASNRPLIFTRSFLQGLAIGLVILTCIAATTRAHAEPLWTRAVIVKDVTITVFVVSEEELRAKQNRRHVSQMVRTSSGGYAELGKISGRDVCYIYVTQDATEETINHEKRHCAGWVHK